MLGRYGAAAQKQRSRRATAIVLQKARFSLPGRWLAHGKAAKVLTCCGLAACKTLAKSAA